MGYVRSRFFIVHYYDRATVKQAREIALETFAPTLVGPIMSGIVNDESGFLIWTSGSKLGWTDDDAHLKATEAFIAALSALEKPPRWCRVTDGEEPGDIEAEQGYDGDWTHTYERSSTVATDEA